MAHRRLSHRRPATATVERVEARVLLSAVTPHHHRAAKHPVPPVPVAVSDGTSAALKPVVESVYVGTTVTPTGAATKGHKARRAKKGKAVTVVAASPAVTPATITGSQTPIGKTAAQMRAAYGLGVAGATAVSYPVSFAGTSGTAVAGDGSGQTIAIVDAYNDPNAASDLHHFSVYYGLPDAPSFQVVNEDGATSPLPGTDPAGPNPQSGSNWEEEESLDIEWAHVMAPKANLILYEADSSDGNDLYETAATAAQNAAVTVVSMSFGGAEYTGEDQNDVLFDTPAGHTGGVTFLASTGDTGGVTEAPAVFPNVVAVGGTSLYLNGDGSYASEAAWGNGGGGVSTGVAQPTYQATAVSAYSTTQRTVPDVAMDADPNTGVSIYDSYDFGADSPWLGGGYVDGGTSLACPLWAGVVAVADQGRAAEGLPSLYSDTGTLTRLYQLPAADYHDVTTGSNGFSAGPGYDLATGLGSPVANKLIPDLAGAATVTGRVFVDANGDGTFDGTDTPVANQQVYLDLNNDGVLDHGDPTATTNAAGTYTFIDQPGGGTVRLVGGPPAGYAAVASATPATVAYGATDTVNLALFPTAFATSAAGAQYTLATNAAGTVAQVSLNGTALDSIAVASLPSLSFTLGGQGDSLTVNAANGDPLPAGGIAVAGTAGRADTLAVVGTPGADALAVSTSAVTFSSVAISYANVSAVSVDPGGGTDSLSVAAGASATVPAPAAGTGLLVRQFSALAVAAGARLSFATATAHADRQVVVTAALSDAGTLDLGGNDMVVHNGSLSAVSGLAATGYAGGLWTGVGLASAAAAANPAHLTALGVIQGSAAGSFDGQAVTATDVLVRYTYYGDANLDGVVNAADYLKVDAGYVMKTTGWANGDFNYDGVVDGSDYTLVDNAFNTQTAPL